MFSQDFFKHGAAIAAAFLLTLTSVAAAVGPARAVETARISYSDAAPVSASAHV